jgi:hypothetical protein
MGNTTCLSRSDCVVAGYLQDQDASPETYRAVIWHWDGSSWVAQATGLTGNAALVGTACATPSDCWAVGARFEGPQLDQVVGLVDHYNGTTWSPSSPPGAAGASLNGIACPSASECVAVGNKQISAEAAHARAYRWDGRAWSVIAAPSPAGALWTVLDSVDCFSATNCLAVGDADNSVKGSGYFFGERFKGASWSLFTMPNTVKFDMGNASYLSLSCPARNSCLATGSAWGYTDGQMGLNYLFGLSYTWDGSSWSSRKWPSQTCFGSCSARSTTGPRDYERFYYPASESCTGPNQCWVGVSLDPIVAEGDREEGPFVNDIAIARWDGSEFQLVKAPVLGEIDAVGCLPAGTGTGTWCVTLGQAAKGWVGTGAQRHPSKLSMTGGYFVESQGAP